MDSYYLRQGSLSVCLFVCLSVCLLATSRKKCSSIFIEILRETKND